jgi:predicted transposase/invertase (TIGR01784 family)
MKADSVYPLSDVMFKQVFGSQQAVDVTAAFLSAVVGLDPGEYRSLHIRDPHLGRRWKKDKLSILDLLINTSSGKFVHVEVQIAAYSAMISRAVYGQAKLLTEQMEAGTRYDGIQEVIGVLILGWTLLKDEDPGRYKNTYRFLNTESHKTFTNLQNFIILELPKVPEKDDGSRLWPWLKYLKCQSEGEFDMLVNTHPEVGIAVRRYRRVSPVKWIRQRIFEYWDAKWVQESREEYVRQEGYEAAEAKSREQLAAKDEQIRRLKEEIRRLRG